MKTSEESLVRSFFRHGSNALILVLLAALGAGMIRSGRLWSLLPYVTLGVVIFLLTEYLSHRFQLHAPPSEARFLKKLQHRLHYDHHTEPNRLDLLFVPMWYVVPLLIVYGAFYFKITGDWGVTQALMFGNLAGLFYYEYVHFIAHVPFTPKTAWGRYMKKYHLWHHYKNENFWYGVTNPMFDRLFGTYRDQAGAERSTTVRKLHER